MRLSAVLLAKVIGYVETADLSPKGTVFLPDLVKELVKRYRFQKFPQSFEQLDDTKGIEFHQGKAGDTVIQKLVIWSTILVIETRSSTADSKRILEEMLVWGADKFGLSYAPGMIKRFAYVSDLTFYSDAPILGANPPLTKLADRTGEALSEIWQEPVRYQPVIFTVGHDPMARKYEIAPFTIQRRAEARLSENKYFSEAPLPTDVHLRLLEQYERDVL